MFTLPSQFNTIRFKLSLVVGLLTVIYTGILVSYFNYRYKQTLVNDAIEKSRVYAQSYSVGIKSQIEAALDLSRATAQMFQSQVDNEFKLTLTRKDASLIIRNLVAENSFLLGMYTAWEPDKFDGLDKQFAGLPDNHPNGHFVPYWYRDTETGKLAFEPLKHFLDPVKGSYYLGPRQTKKETVVDPISYKIGNLEVLLMTLVVPILDKQENFVGIVGADISTESIQKMIEESSIFDGQGIVSIVSNNGIIVANSANPDWIGSKIQFKMPSEAAKLSNVTDLNIHIESDTLRTFVPITFGKTTTPWYVLMKVPVSYLTKGLVYELIKLTLIGFIFLTLLIFTISYVILKLLKPIRKITRIAQKVAVGNLNVWDVDSTSLEIEQLNEAFKKVIDSQKQITEVTQSIAEGSFDKRANVKSEYDSLAKSVNLMMDNLQKAAEEEKVRSWTNEGYTQFSELIRNEKEVKQLCHTALQFLIRYLKAVQGGVFVVEENQGTVLELKAAYAYNRVKYLQKTILPGEGLTGQCYLEKETTYLTEIPNDYVHITSGLGQANPKCLVIVPLINNETVEGVLEIASFTPLADYQVVFLEKCATGMAAVIGTARINELTGKLLAEAQDQAEQMRMQEEEMRQNMEELAATQEELRRREETYIQKIKELEQKLV